MPKKKEEKAHHPLTPKLHTLSFPFVPMHPPFTRLKMDIPTFRGITALVVTGDLGQAVSEASIDLATKYLSYTALMSIGRIRFGNAREEGGKLEDIQNVVVGDLGILKAVSGAIQLDCRMPGGTIELLIGRNGLLWWPRQLHNPQGARFKGATATRNALQTYSLFAGDENMFDEFVEQSNLKPFYDRWAEIILAGNQQNKLDQLIQQYPWLLK